MSYVTDAIAAIIGTLDGPKTYALHFVRNKGSAFVAPPTSLIVSVLNEGVSVRDESQQILTPADVEREVAGRLPNPTDPKNPVHFALFDDNPNNNGLSWVLQPDGHLTPSILHEGNDDGTQFPDDNGERYRITDPGYEVNLPEEELGVMALSLVFLDQLAKRAEGKTVRIAMTVSGQSEVVEVGMKGNQAVVKEGDNFPLILMSLYNGSYLAEHGAAFITVKLGDTRYRWVMDSGALTPEGDARSTAGWDIEVTDTELNELMGSLEGAAEAFSKEDEDKRFTAEMKPEHKHLVTRLLGELPADTEMLLVFKYENTEHSSGAATFGTGNDMITRVENPNVLDYAASHQDELTHVAILSLHKDADTVSKGVWERKDGVLSPVGEEQAQAVLEQLGVQ